MGEALAKAAVALGFGDPEGDAAQAGAPPGGEGRAEIPLDRRAASMARIRRASASGGKRVPASVRKAAMAAWTMEP